MKKGTKLLIIVAVVVALALGGLGTVLAADPGGTTPPSPRPVNITGKIVSITPEDPTAPEHVIALEAGSGSLEVTTNADTKYKVPGVKEPSLADLAVGDNVAVRAVSIDGKLVANVVLKVPVKVLAKGLLRRVKEHAVVGNVTDIEGANIALDGPQGSVMVVTSADTKYEVPGVKDATIADVKVGDTVMAVGNKVDAGVEAKLVAVMPQAPLHIIGTVTEVTDTTVTATDKDGRTFTVTLPEGTAAVKLGQRVNIVIGDGAPVLKPAPQLNQLRQQVKGFFKGRVEGRLGKGPFMPWQQPKQTTMRRGMSF